MEKKDYYDSEFCGPCTVKFVAGPEEKWSTVGCGVFDVYTSESGRLYHFSDENQNIPLNTPILLTGYIDDLDYSFYLIHVYEYEIQYN